jgi:cytochrome c553
MGKTGVAAVIALALGAVSIEACSLGHSPGLEIGPMEPGFGGSSSSGGGFAQFQPTFGPLVTQENPPPPISGGTLLVTHDGHTIVAADPDRDQVYVVDVTAQQLLFTVPLQAGDEPGRVAEDGAGRVHVALRGGGALVTIDPTSGTILARRPVCPAPRGVAWDSTQDVVYVACATGELVTLPSAGGAATSSVVVERDLRDVFVQDGTVYVSTFRAAEFLKLGSDGSVAQRTTLPQDGLVPHVAWRTFVDVGGDVVMLHQAQSAMDISTQQPGAYGGSGGPSAVESQVDVLGLDGTSYFTYTLSDVSLPVDAAVSPDRTHILVAAAGNAFSPQLESTQYLTFGTYGSAVSETMGVPPGQVVAVAFDSAGEGIAQAREPAALWLLTPGDSDVKSIALSSVSRADTGHDIFHTQAGALIACASCHPEGGDDGHVWTFDSEARRTPSLRGTIAGTAPYHWPGDMADFATLTNDVYTQRMSGAVLGTTDIRVLQAWVQAIPAPPAPSWVDPAAAQRGQTLFESADIGCTACHTGPKLTNNATLDVGTGGNFQVPPLVGVGWRTPLLHDGCAATLTDRFVTCASSQHGSTSGLSAAGISDLVAYLETL